MTQRRSHRILSVDWLWGSSRSGFTLGLLLAVLLGLTAAAPFLTRPGLPRATDAELHVYRAAQLGDALRAGAFYPRWAPDFYYGYGYPIFNYYAPCTYYLANLFDLLPGLDIVAGVKAVFVLGLLCVAVGAYLLGNDLFGAVGGVVSAAGAVLSPYVVLLDPHARGDLAEHFAVCLLPLALYVFRRLLGGGGRWAFLGSVAMPALMVFSHNLLGPINALLMLAYGLWEVFAGGRHDRAGWGALALLLSAAAIAFFWLPAGLEWSAVHLQVTGPGHFDFREHFLSLGDLLGPVRIPDFGAVTPRYRFNAGLVQWILALLGLPALAFLPRRVRLNLGFFLAVSAGLVFLLLPISTPVWSGVPGMAYLQFPWRLLGPLATMLALCAGASAAWLSLLPLQLPWLWLRPGSRMASIASAWMPALALLSLCVSSLPALYPPLWPADFGDTSARGYLSFELSGQALGTTSTGDFVPSTSLMLPGPADTLLASYESGLVDKVNRATLPAGATVTVQCHGPLEDRFHVCTPDAFVLRLYTLYFPGWRAEVEGQEVPIELGMPEGFITLWVPEGCHSVRIYFADTAARRAGWAVAVVGWLGIVVALALWRSPGRSDVHHSPLVCPQSLQRGALLACGVSLLGFVLFKLALADTHDDWFRYTSPSGQALAAQHVQRASLGEQVALLGYDLSSTRLRPGAALRLVLYWHTPVSVPVNYQAFAHLIGPDGRSYGQSDVLNPGGLPVSRWPTDRYVWDEHKIRIAPDAPAGHYRVVVGLYTLADGWRLPVVDSSGEVIADSIELAVPVEVRQ